MTINRRDAIKWAAASVAAAHFASARAESTDWDVIVVGAGTAGLPAALFAASRGLRTLLLEKAGQIGGTLWFSGGQMSAAATRRQRALGIQDDADQHHADIMAISGNTANSDLVRLAVKHAAGTLDWLDSRGFDFAEGLPVKGTGHEPYSQPRVWSGTKRGISILNLLQQELRTAVAKPTVITQFTVDELLMTKKDRGVAGVRGVDATGNRRDFRGRHVILASGGCGSEQSAFTRFNAVPQYKAAGWPANTGMGMTLALAAGGYLRGQENYLCDFGSIPASLSWPSPDYGRSIHHPQRRPPWEILVNSRGQRFIREDEASVHARELALSKQPDHRYWCVFDESIRAAAPPLVVTAPPGPARTLTQDELKAEFGTNPAFISAMTLHDLAAQAGIDAAGLAESVAVFNRSVAGAADPLGRQHSPRAIEKPPYYAIRHQGGSLLSFAGAAVDDKLRVIRKDGTPVANLHAIGEMLGMGNLSGRAYCGGMMVTPALSFGRWLGSTLT